MVSATLDEATGAVLSDPLIISPALNWERSQEALLGQAHLVYGAGETAKYALRRPVELFGAPFRACLIFEAGALASLSLHRMAEPRDMQEEFDALAEILGASLSVRPTSERALQRVWRYAWGEVAILGQLQDLSVFVSVSWGGVERATGGAHPLSR